MRFRRVIVREGGSEDLAVYDATAERWLPIAATAEALGDRTFQELPDDLIALLAGGGRTREILRSLCSSASEQDTAPACELAPLLPFRPLLMRAFATSERHWLQSARGHVRRNMPRALPVISAVEFVTRRPFRPFRPGKLFYEEPAYYIGNALTFVPDGAEAPWPAYSKALDFELELGAVVVREVRDASVTGAREAIGGFVVVNDLSARDTQWREIRHGIFGPLSKTKTFASAMSAELVSADEILDRARQLNAEVKVNGEVWSRTDTTDQRWSFEEMLAFASRGETIQPGELMSSGTLHDGCSLEIGRWVSPGDTLELTVEGVGSLRNVIGAPR